jgi:hypothetical protein
VPEKNRLCKACARSLSESSVREGLLLGRQPVVRPPLLSLYLPCASDARPKHPFLCKANRRLRRRSRRCYPTRRSFRCRRPSSQRLNADIDIDGTVPATDGTQRVLLQPRHASMPARPRLLHVPGILQRSQRPRSGRSSRLHR